MTITEAQLLARASYIGASDVAAIMGLDPYRTAGDVWLEKTGAVPPGSSPDTPAIKLGRIIEPVLLRLCSEEFGVSISENMQYSLIAGSSSAMAMGTMMTVVGAPLVVHPDGVVLGKDGLPLVVVEAKLTSLAGEWGDEEAGEIPLRVAVQVQAQMLASRATTAIVPVMLAGGFGLPEVRFYEIHADAEIQEQIGVACAKFWWDNVKAGVRPPESPSLESLARVTRNPKGGPASIPTALVDDLQRARSAAAIAGKNAEVAKAAVVSALGTAEVGADSLGRIVTFYEQSTSGYTVPARTSRVLRVKSPKQED